VAKWRQVILAEAETVASVSPITLCLGRVAARVAGGRERPAERVQQRVTFLAVIRRVDCPGDVTYAINKTMTFVQVVFTLIDVFVADVRRAGELIVAIRYGARLDQHLAAAAELNTVAEQAVIGVISVVGDVHAHIAHVARIIGARVAVIAVRVDQAGYRHADRAADAPRYFLHARVVGMTVEN
jgi:hypothetical protein